jgi:hypothetical protein
MTALALPLSLASSRSGFHKLLALLLVIGLGMLLSFSGGAWTNLGLALMLYSVLHLLTVRGSRASSSSRSWRRLGLRSWACWS